MMLAKSSLQSVLSLSLLTLMLAPGVAFAAPLSPASDVHVTTAGKPKMVHFSVRNQSGAAIELSAGDQLLVVNAGQTIDIKLPSGTLLVNKTKADKPIVCQVTKALADSTVVLN